MYKYSLANSQKCSECVWKLLLLVLQHVQWSTGNLWSIDISHIRYICTPRHVEICWKGETDSDCVSEYRSVGPGANTGTMVGSVWTEKEGGRGVLQTKVVSQVEQNQNHKSDCCRVTSVVGRNDSLTIRIRLFKPFGSNSGLLCGLENPYNTRLRRWP